MPFDKTTMLDDFAQNSAKLGQAVGRPDKDGKKGVDTTIVQSQAQKTNAARKAAENKKKATSAPRSYFKATPKRTARMSLACTEELKQKLQEKCSAEHRSMNDVLSSILGEALGMEEGTY